MNWYTRQLRQRAREAEENFMRPKSNKPKFKVPKGFKCWNCMQEVGSGPCRGNRKTGKPCDAWVKLQEMAKRGELEYE